MKRRLNLTIEVDDYVADHFMRGVQRQGEPFTAWSAALDTDCVIAAEVVEPVRRTRLTLERDGTCGPRLDTDQVALIAEDDHSVATQRFAKSSNWKITGCEQIESYE